MILLLQEARDRLMARLDEEDNFCPCCDQRARRYPRTLHSSMAAGLIRATRLFSFKPFKIDRDLGRQFSSDFAKLRFWGLIEECEDGHWGLTILGLNFVNVYATVPSTANIYNNTLVSLSGKQITIRDALGTEFNYESLMSGEAEKIIKEIDG